MSYIQLEEEFTKYFNLSKRYKKRHLLEVNDHPPTKTQGKVLYYIYQVISRGEKIYQKDIEKKFTIRRSTATELLKSLEAEGYIVRKTSKEDARLKEISLTKKANEGINSLQSSLISYISVLKTGITKEEIETLLKILQKINANLEKEEQSNA